MIFNNNIFRLVLLFYLCCLVDGLSSSNTQSKLSNLLSNRGDFLRNLSGFITSASSFMIASAIPSQSTAIEFIPASPSFSYSYKDAKEIILAQRLACDDIRTVVARGSIEEAGFKLMQLNAQVSTGGKILLNTLQGQTSSSSGVNLVRFLKCQERFSILLDQCSQCEIQLSKALQGKLGTFTAAQLKILTTIDDTINAYDEFLRELESSEVYMNAKIL